MEEKELGSTSSASSPLPVPAAMKTSRTLPRIIALLTICAWVPLFWTGMGELHRNAGAARTPLDQFLVSGEHYWGHRLASGGCLAYFTSRLDLPAPIAPQGRPTADQLLPSPQFSLSGAVRLRVFGDPAVAELALDAQFSPLLALEEFSSSLHMGQTGVRARGEGGDLTVQAQNGEFQWRERVRRPEGIYLIKRATDRFSLRLPESVQRLFKVERAQEAPVQPLEELSAEEYAQCKAAVEDRAPDAEASSVDIGPYLRAFGVQPESPFISNMTRRSET